MRQEILNPMEDGTVRTIKAQYQQSSAANFIRQDGLGASGVICFIDLTRGGTAQKPQEQSRRDTTQESLTEQATIVACWCNKNRVKQTKMFGTIVARYNQNGLLCNQGNPAVLEKW